MRRRPTLLSRAQSAIVANTLACQYDARVDSFDD